jgi:hypothetical protein
MLQTFRGAAAGPGTNQSEPFFNSYNTFEMPPIETDVYTKITSAPDFFVNFSTINKPENLATNL